MYDAGFHTVDHILEVQATCTLQVMIDFIFIFSKSISGPFIRIILSDCEKEGLKNEEKTVIDDQCCKYHAYKRWLRQHSD